MRLLAELVEERGTLIGRESFVVQIGANDGLCAGPDGLTSTCPVYPLIRRLHWPGILIEPVPWLFEKLRAAYAGHDNLIFERIAISETPGRRAFYRIREDGPALPWFAHKISGFSDMVIRDELRDRPDLEQILVVEDVECETLDAVLERHGRRDIDILQVDAEGYDGAIVRSLDFARLSPQVVIFEHKHLKAAERLACIDLLETAGYTLRQDENDMMAVRRPTG